MYFMQLITYRGRTLTHGVNIRWKSVTQLWKM